MPRQLDYYTFKNYANLTFEIHHFIIFNFFFLSESRGESESSFGIDSNDIAFIVAQREVKMDWMYVDPEDSAQQVCQNELGTVNRGSK